MSLALPGGRVQDQRSFDKVEMHVGFSVPINAAGGEPPASVTVRKAPSRDGTAQAQAAENIVSQLIFEPGET